MRFRLRAAQVNRCAGRSPMPLRAAMDCAWICGKSARRRSTRQLVSGIANRPQAL